ncbi:hypothetical protein LEMLEM_LOCUS19397, partial [Lemmus lemmus]
GLITGQRLCNQTSGLQLKRQEEIRKTGNTTPSLVSRWVWTTPSLVSRWVWTTPSLVFR